MTPAELMQSRALAGFKAVYAEELAIELVKNPTNYPWPADRIPEVVERMTTAIYYGRFASSNVLRRVAKRIGLQYSQKRLSMFVRMAVGAL
jgi:hypothetical protein